MNDAALHVADPFWLRRINIVFPLPQGSKTSSIKWCRNCKQRGIFGTKMRPGVAGDSGVAEAENRFLES
jgi:hypothetical protein